MLGLQIQSEGSKTVQRRTVEVVATQLVDLVAGAAGDGQRADGKAEGCRGVGLVTPAVDGTVAAV